MEDTVVTVEAEEGASVVVDDSPEAGIEALRQQMTAAEEGRKKAETDRDEYRRLSEMDRVARDEAERRAQHASAEAQTRGEKAFQAEYDSVINAAAAANADLVNAKTMLRNAMAEGDFEKVADVSAEIGLIAAKVRNYENGKKALDDQRERGATTPQTGGYNQVDDQKESFIRSRSPRTAAWLRQNDKYFTDRNFALAVSGAHNLAVARGIAPDSDDYFLFIEEQAGAKPAAAAVATPVVAAVTAPRVSPSPAAPAANSTGAAVRPNHSGGQVTLSADEREFCRTNGISEANYAKHKIGLIAENRIGVGH